MGKRFVAGIDPGSTGACVVIDQDLKIHYRRHFDELTDQELAEVIRLVARSYRPVVVKEIFIASYSNGNTAFTVGRQHGVLDLIIAEQGLRRIDVRAKEWQTALFPKDTKHLQPKYLSLQTAARLYGEGADFRIPLKKKLSKNPHLGIVDALNLAAYGISLLAPDQAGHSKVDR